MTKLLDGSENCVKGSVRVVTEDNILEAPRIITKNLSATSADVAAEIRIGNIPKYKC
jgi:hypothetical protein